MSKDFNNNSEENKEIVMKYGGITVIASILVIFIILAVFNINFGQWLADSIMWFYRNYGVIGIYIGVFLISIFGNFTVIFPVPYVIALIVISAVLGTVNPIMLGLFGALGASIGEVSAWLIGRGSQKIIGDSDRIEHMKKYIELGWAPVIIFIFAATPLPDDAFLIVLGIAEYSIIKTLIFTFIGKFVLCFLCSALPIWFADTTFGNFLFNLFGINLEAARTGVIPPNSPIDILGSSLVWAATIIIMFLLVYIDWGKIFKKLKKKKDLNKRNKEI
ncbi:MAG: VTT domain-containing protein [Promethearchaeota archaeon]